MARGASYGAPTAQETELADLVAELVPSMQMMRFTSSGTEAVMGALRVARGFTGRDLVVKFEGCYHGGADYLLVKAGSGLATFGVPTSAGVPASIASTCVVLPYNDATALEDVFAARGNEIAAVILEPVVGNMGTVPPSPAFLEALVRLTRHHEALLVFDEVMTGFRVARGGAQELFGITPDLTTMGKIAGGGLPLGIYGGRADVMRKVAPIGPVYQAGTLSGNPLAVAAGLATLRVLRDDRTFYERLEAKSAALAEVLGRAAARSSKPVRIQRTGSMLTPFFTDREVRSWEDAATSDTAAFGRWHRGMLDAGVHWPPAQYEAGFVSIAHDEATLEATAKAAEVAFSAV
jgi:glutamate-1-semialdehyde 2,1-aminomutase